MKVLHRLLLIVVLLTPLSVTLPVLTGCKPATATTTPAQLAPGYISQADQQMKGVLDAAQAFYNRLRTDSIAGKVTLTQAEKDALNKLGTAINTAQPVYLLYHNGSGTQTAAQNAIDQVAAQQAQIQAMGVK